MKNIIKLCLALSVVSVFVLSCTSKTLHKDKKSTLSPDTNIKENASGNPTTSTSSTTSSTVIPDDGSPKDTEAAFKDVLKVLHASYEAGDCFFKLKFDTPSTDTAPAEIVKNGSDSTVIDAAGVGAGSPEGQGTYTITATGAPTTVNTSNGTDAKLAIPVTVTYEYKDYQPKGSHIIINGKIETTGHTSVLNWLKIKKGQYSLKITGLYEAELIFDASNANVTGGEGVLRELSSVLTTAGLCIGSKEDVKAFTIDKGIKATFTYKKGTPLPLATTKEDSPLLNSFLKLPAATVVAK